MILKPFAFRQHKIIFSFQADGIRLYKDVKSYYNAVKGTVTLSWSSTAIYFNNAFLKLTFTDWILFWILIFVSKRIQRIAPFINAC